jgi:membrane associated rhomboid family serine protease
MSYRPVGFGNPFGFAITPWVKRLLIANGVIFLLTMAFEPAIHHYGAFIPARLLSQPWGIVTYMFIHGGLLHLIFNAIGLFFFGPPLEERWGSSEFIKFYMICGIGGALLSMFWWNTAIIGSSAAVFGVMLAYAFYWPNNPILIWGIIPLKAKYLIVILTLFSLYSLSPIAGSGDGIAHLAHLGGFAAALLYLKSPYAPSQYGGAATWGAAKPRPARPSARETAARVRKTLQLDRIQRVEPQTAEEEKLLDDVDRILDKISAQGLQSLTPEERQKLDDASKKYRTN